MQKATLGVLAMLFVLAAADTKPTSATYLTGNDVQSTLKGMPPNSVTDKQVRMVDTGKQNVGSGSSIRAGSPKHRLHDQVTEVYHILAGSGTMVTGGTLVKPQRRPSNDVALRELTSPSITGASLQEGESRHVGPGDIVIIPAGVGHWFSTVDGSIDCVVVRIDPDKIVHLK